MTIKNEIENICKEIDNFDFINADTFKLERLASKLGSLVSQIEENSDECTMEDLDLLKKQCEKLLNSSTSHKKSIEDKISNIKQSSKGNVAYINNIRKL